MWYLMQPLRWAAATAISAFLLAASTSDSDATCDAEGVCAPGTSAARSIPLVVVEEHHHVVDHWFSLPGVHEGMFNATLVHIDGHCDFAPPLQKELIAPWPENLPKLREDLENDQFIWMAARWGIIRRIVNIYPTWTRAYVRPDQKRERFFLSGPHKSGKKWCTCTAPCYDEVKCKRKCWADERNVRSSDCTLEAKLDVIDYGLDRAIAEGFGVDANQPFLLDFDEDYFAVESPFVQSMKTGHVKKDVVSDAAVDVLTRDGFAPASWRSGKVLATIQQRLHGVFCAMPPREAQREQAVDIFMRGVASIVLAFKEAGKKPSKDGKSEMEDLIGRFALQNTSLQHEVRDALCESRGSDVEDEAHVLEVAKDFASMLASYVPVQGIHTLIGYGFCTDCDEVPRSNYSLWLCMGSSEADDERTGRIELHETSADEVTLEMSKLRSLLLSQLQRTPPTMITVCRSVRDGYIPRQIWRSIEDGVIEISSALAKSWGSNLKPIYDRGCYWGANGTPSRLVPPIADFLASEAVPTAGYYISRITAAESATA